MLKASLLVPRRNHTRCARNSCVAHGLCCCLDASDHSVSPSEAPETTGDAHVVHMAARGQELVLGSQRQLFEAFRVILMRL